MPVAPRSSRKAVLALGAITGFVSPKLAGDAKLDATGITAILAKTTGKNWLQQKSRLATALIGALGKVKLANDAKPDADEVHRLLDSLDGIVGDEDMPENALDEEEETKEEREERMRDRAEDRDCGLDAAKDEDPETEEEKKKRMEARDRKARRANDARRKLGRDEKDEEREEREKKEKAEDERMKAEDRMRRAKDKRPAMDAAAVQRQIKAAEDRVVARMRGIQEAERDVMPWIGSIAVAQDSAAEVYKLALDTIGIDVEGVHPSAYRAILFAQPKPGEQRQGARVAQDSAGNASYYDFIGDVGRRIVSGA